MKLIHNNKEKGDIIFKVLVGSHAYGTNIEGSDVDIKGIFLQSSEDVLEHGYQEQVTVSDDEVYYEIRRFIELSCSANPTMLEVLFSPEDCIIYKHPVMDYLLENRDKFISKSCKWSFGGYAISQIQKAEGLNKKMNWEEQYKQRKTIFDFCNIANNTGGSKPILELLSALDIPKENIGLSSIPNMKDCYAVFFSDTIPYKGIGDENSDNVRLSSIPKEGLRNYLGVMHFNLDAYSNHCKKYKEYTEWLAKRNVQRYVDIEGHGQRIDGKNMLHCIRLIEVGKEIAEGKGLNVRRPNAEYLISIRKGKVNLKTLLSKAENLLNEMMSLYEKSDLPEKADRGFFLKLMPKIRKEYYENK